MTIYNILTQIEQNEVVLPAIQRDFVWDEPKIQKLLDSIMRGYPIGLIMMWETYEDIQYRHFVSENIPENRPLFHENPNGKKLRLVLDGQQRLQSLYVAIFGKFDGQSLHFDVLSGRDKDDFEEEKYHFVFASAEEVDAWNSQAKQWLNASDNSNDPDYEPRYFIRVDLLFGMDARDKIRFRSEVYNELKLDEEDRVRLEANLARLDDAFIREGNILEMSIIDQDVPSTSRSRQSESDVLEIFVRVNRQGTPLSRSDLIFSMLKLNWRESASDLPDFVEKINRRNAFNLDVDFVIRCLFAVSDLGTKFDVDLLRKRRNIELIRENYKRCCDAIKSTVDMVEEHCWIASSRALGGYFPLIPMVYYLYQAPKQQLPIDQVHSFRKALFIFAFSKVFSRYAESRLSRFIREALKPLGKNGDATFPFEAVVQWVRYWEGIKSFDRDLIQRHSRLAHYLVQGYRGTEAHFIPNMQEMDHIFPRSELRRQGKDAIEINSFANFWILGKGKNQNKSNKHPKDYFENVPDSMMDRAYIDREMLNYRLFRRFLEQRSHRIEGKLVELIGYTPEDFPEVLTGEV